MKGGHVNTKSVVRRNLWFFVLCCVITTVNIATAIGSMENIVPEVTVIPTIESCDTLHNSLEHTFQDHNIEGLSNETHIAFLFGIISDIEKNQEGDFRFLPIKILNIGYYPGEGLYAQVLDDTYGGYPCCGYIDNDEFHGVMTDRFICGFWIIRVE